MNEYKKKKKKMRWQHSANTSNIIQIKHDFAHLRGLDNKASLWQTVILDTLKG